MSHPIRSILDGRCKIHVGDCIDVMRSMPANSVDCVVTSPPYWGLRDYGVSGQIGLEPTLGEHLEVMVSVFREIRRILKVHGTVWVNYGDCYAAQPNGKSAAAYKADGADDRTFRDKPFSTIGPILQPDARGPQRAGAKEGYRADSGFTVRPGGYLKPKDLCMIPNRLAIALQDDGWWVRSEIIWNKTNPKPESIDDRPAAVHEKIWLLTKSERYFFDAESLKEPTSGNAHARRKDGQYKPAKGSTAGQNREGTWVETYVPDLRNGRNVWTFNIEGYRGAHFATFPRELARRCILAGAPKTVCGCCGAAEGCGPICETFDRVPGVVLDPFGGSGTVALVAEQHGYRSALIELKPEYADIAELRIMGAPIPIEDDEAAA
ncbi:site-specific DNA-methyltransferase [Agrobacterium rhizogenes]|uniref:DNA-methyltransferase n=1 Tax=Rhizobium rhizogenes TaxID=359 RepID=UPI001573BEA7|nr:site-specific DNA-methyltransferase [Rhizobium rhizogenes]NTG86178.1 site-specific DNA-methyltransferase [Rhizobium rhizogenes]